MTNRQLEQINEQLPQGETFNRAYQAFEGDIRVISEDDAGNEYRYTVRFDEGDNATIERM